MTTEKTFTYSHFSICPATAADVPEILSLIQALADYEHLREHCHASEELLDKWLFQEKIAEVIIAEADDQPIGFALYFTSFSTFLGLPGIYLEDLFVRPQARGFGFVKKLLSHLAGLVVERGFGRLEWSCLNWNEPSIQFYLSLGAVPMDEWTTYRLTDDALRQLAGSVSD